MHRNYLPGLLYRFLEQEDSQEECHLIISGYLRKAARVVQPRQGRDYVTPPPSYLGFPSWLIGISSPYVHYAIVVLVTIDRFDYYTCLTKLQQDPELFYLTAACYFGNLRLVKQVIARENQSPTRNNYLTFRDTPAVEVSRLASIDLRFYQRLRKEWKCVFNGEFPLVDIAACVLLLMRDDAEICKAVAYDALPGGTPRQFINFALSRTTIHQGPNLSAL